MSNLAFKKSKLIDYLRIFHHVLLPQRALRISQGTQGMVILAKNLCAPCGKKSEKSISNPHFFQNKTQQPNRTNQKKLQIFQK